MRKLVPWLLGPVVVLSLAAGDCSQEWDPEQPPPGTDPRFVSCEAAHDQGFGLDGYRRDVDEEYNWYRDPDADGVVCEGSG